MADTRTNISSSNANRFALLGVMLLICQVGLSQPRLQQHEIFVGAYGGATAATVFFTPTVGGMSDLLKVPIGWNAGAVFRYGAHKHCSLQLEAGYAQRGWREYSATYNYDYTRTLHYLQVPMLAHIHFGSEHFRGFFNLGPQLAYCLASNEHGTQQTASTYQYRPIDHQFDWGAAGGFGLYAIGRYAGVYQLELRAHYSFGSIYNTARTEHFAASNMLTVSLNFAYMWQIK